MIFFSFSKNQVLGFSWSTLLWYRCYYPQRSRDALCPVCGIFCDWKAVINSSDLRLFNPDWLLPFYVPGSQGGAFLPLTGLLLEWQIWGTHLLIYKTHSICSWIPRNWLNILVTGMLRYDMRASSLTTSFLISNRPCSNKFNDTLDVCQGPPTCYRHKCAHNMKPLGPNVCHIVP